MTGAALAAPVTLASPVTVMWNAANSLHPLYLDDGASTCVISNQQSAYSHVFSAPGTFYFHCGTHGTCSPNNATCPVGACGGMAGTLVIQ